MISIIQLIREELEDFYDYGDEQNMADRYFEKNYGTQTIAPPESENQIDAELIGYVDRLWNQRLINPIPLYKNPKKLQGFGANSRGVLLEDGTLILAPTANIMHDNILDSLGRLKIIPYGKSINYNEYYPDEFIAIQRFGNTNTFTQSSAYDKFPEYYNEIFETGNRIQPFEFKYVEDNNLNELESPLDPMNQYSNMPQNYDANILYEINKLVREESDDIYGDKNRGKLKRTGEEFWIGTVNIYDGEIEEIHTYEEARNNDFHHSFYFSPSQVEKMTDGECMIFWINSDGIQAEWTMGKANPDIINKIKQQINLI